MSSGMQLETVDHGETIGLTDDDHTQYVMLTGRVGGQNVRGGTAANDNLTLESTSNATKGDVVIQPNGGNVGIETSSPEGKLDIRYNEDTDVEKIFLFLEHLTMKSHYLSGNGQEMRINFDKSRGTSSSPAVLNSGDHVGRVVFRGYDGVGYVRCADIRARIDGTPGLDDMPGRLEFRVQADGSSGNPSLAMVIKNDGDVGIGVSSPSTKLQVDGPVRMGQYTVSTLPSASSSGAGSMVFVSDDEGGAVMAFSDGTNWRRVTDRAIVS